VRAAASQGTDLALVEERFAQWGGIPRFVFEHDQNKLLQDLQGFITGMDLGLVEKYLKTPELSGKDQEFISHMVVQYRTVGGSFSECESDFASDWIGEKIVKAKAKHDYKKLLAHYRSVKQNGKVYMLGIFGSICATQSFRLATMKPLGTQKKHVRICKGKKLVVGKGNLAGLNQILQNDEYFQLSRQIFR
jgi:hypothetical protein